MKDKEIIDLVFNESDRELYSIENLIVGFHLSRNQAEELLQKLQNPNDRYSKQEGKILAEHMGLEKGDNVFQLIADGLLDTDDIIPAYKHYHRIESLAGKKFGEW